ncbi:MAG: hypothetical protein QXF26_08815, partial [Candidatus Bathyarchaeia archaeon]
NIIILATKMCDESGRDYYAPAKLILDIYHYCHKVAVDSELIKRYLKQANRIPSESMGFKAIRIIHEMLKDTRKCLHIEPMPERFEESIPPDDRPIFRLAVRAGAILVTTDGRLRCKVSGLGLKVASPEEALEYAT